MKRTRSERREVKRRSRRQKLAKSGASVRLLWQLIVDRARAVKKGRD
jgi:hypothetical protein